MKLFTLAHMLNDMFNAILLRCRLPDGKCLHILSTCCTQSKERQLSLVDIFTQGSAL